MSVKQRPLMMWWCVLLLAACLSGCSSASTAQTQVPVARHVPKNHAWARPTRAQTDQLAARILATMTLDQKIGQLFMQGFSTVGFNDQYQQIMQQIQPGGTVWYAFQMPDIQTTRNTIAAVQRISPIPMLTAADNEGGFINNLRNMYPPFPSATSIGATHDPGKAYADSKLIAQDMLAVGLNTDLAPVVDVQTVPYGADIHDRTYGTTPDQVIQMAGAALAGLQENGVIGTLKHFPGLGAAVPDAHFTLPIVNRTRDELEQIDLAPYRAMLHGDDPPGMVMGTDVLMPDIDPSLPSELSPTFMTGILRNELHYDGVVLTDALYMLGVTNPTKPYYAGMTMYQAGVQALIAGCDMLNFSFDLPKSLQMRATIEAAIQNGQLTIARINQSVMRVLRLKIERGLIPFHPETPPGAPQPQIARVADAIPPPDPLPI